LEMALQANSQEQLAEGQQHVTAGLSGWLTQEASGSTAAVRSEHPFFTAAALASLLAHGCLTLILILHHPHSDSHMQANEIPVGVGAHARLTDRRPAMPAETAHHEIAIEASADSKTRNVPASGASEIARVDQQPAPESHPAPPFESGLERFRAGPVPFPARSGAEAMGYSLIVGGMLERAKHYPKSAKQRGAKGVAVIGFVLDGFGRVASVSLLRSSGEPDLDAESAALVNRAAPFPPPPPGAKRTFAIEVAFGMGK
jgi:TonB family protein